MVVITIMCLCSFVFGGAGFAQPVKLDAEERPFVVFTSLEQLEHYRANHKGDFFNLTVEEYGNYGEAFFENHALVMFLTQGMSGSIKCVSESARLDDGKLFVTVKEISPSMHTMDLRYNTLVVSVPINIAQEIVAVYIQSYRVNV